MLLTSKLESSWQCVCVCVPCTVILGCIFLCCLDLVCIFKICEHPCCESCFIHQYTRQLALLLQAWISIVVLNADLASQIVNTAFLNDNNSVFTSTCQDQLI